MADTVDRYPISFSLNLGSYIPDTHNFATKCVLVLISKITPNLKLSQILVLTLCSTLSGSMALIFTSTTE